MMEITRKYWEENIRPRFDECPNIYLEGELIEFASKALDIIDPIPQPRDVIGKGKRCICLEVAGMLNFTQAGVALGDCQICHGTGVMPIEKCNCVKETYVSFLGVELPVVDGLDSVPRSECIECGGTGYREREEPKCTADLFAEPLKCRGCSGKGIVGEI
jgi:hypothetical protein